jgi:hypothetical protein
VREASAGAVGVASDVIDLGPVDTSPRMAAYAVECDLEVENVLFGEPPQRTRLTGTASVPPGQRDGSRFPPDLLRETPFWDEAEPGTSARVLALFGGDSPVTRLLTSDDPLVEDIRDIRRWIERRASADDILATLERRAAGPVAFAAGFQLLVSEGADPADAFNRVHGLPRTDAALAGVVDRLRVDAPWDDAALVDVAEALAAGWDDEREPATLVAYLTWFDTFHSRLLAARPKLRDEVVRLTERDASASFDGPNGAAWTGEVRRRAEALRNEVG